MICSHPLFFSNRATFLPSFYLFRLCASKGDHEHQLGELASGRSSWVHSESRSGLRLSQCQFLRYFQVNVSWCPISLAFLHQKLLSHLIPPPETHNATHFFFKKMQKASRLYCPPRVEWSSLRLAFLAGSSTWGVHNWPPNMWDTPPSSTALYFYSCLDTFFFFFKFSINEYSPCPMSFPNFMD